jgi:CubicO group peptidase (beta-lactamase class C family)
MSTLNGKRNRTQTWLALAALGVGLLIAAVLGSLAYMSTTAPLHRDPGAVPSVATSRPQPRWVAAVEQARQIVHADLIAQNLPGLSVAVGAEDGIVWAEGFGWADLQTRVPVSPETRFRIGTASIALTSAGVGLLLEQNRLTLDETIQAHVPEFPAKQWPVTLRQLMGHLAGIGSDGGDESPLYSVRCERPVEGLRAFANRSLRFEPGTQFRDSSFGWILVSAAVEAAADEPFLTFMQKRIFEPLGMRDTRADALGEPIQNLATSYFPRFAADPGWGLHLMRPVDTSCYAGASVFLSTASDLVRFAMAINRGTLLPPATVALLQSPQRLSSGQETGYGLGWDLETATLAGRPTPAVGHDGESLGGMAASLWTFPEHGIVVSVLSNISYADTYGLAVKIAEAFSAGRTSPADRPTAGQVGPGSGGSR